MIRLKNQEDKRAYFASLNAKYDPEPFVDDKLVYPKPQILAEARESKVWLGTYVQDYDIGAHAGQMEQEIVDL